MNERPTRGMRERGAALPEYALVVAFIVVALIGGISYAQDRSTEQLNDSDGKISQPDEAYYAGGVSTTTTVGTTTTTAAGAVGVHLEPSPTATIADDGNRWLTTVTFKLLDSSGNGVIGTTMNGSWSDGGGGSDPTSTCTTSSSAGTCTVQFTKIKDQNKTVTYTLSTVTGGTFVWQPQAVGEGVVESTCGSPIC